MQKLDCYTSSIHLLCRNNWIDCIDYTKAAGFTGIELFGNEGNVNFEYLPEERCMEVAAHARKVGLKLAIHPWLDWSKLPEDEMIAKYKMLVKRSVDMGMAYINMHLHFVSDRRQGMERLFRATDACMPLLEGSSTILLYENVPDHGIRDLGSEAQDFDKLFKRYSADVPVRMNIDTGHAHIMHAMQPLAEDYGDRWVYSHVHDNDQLEDQHLAPGSGTLSFDMVAELSQNVGYTGPLLMEYNQHYLEAGMIELNRAYGAKGYTLDNITP